MRQQLQKSLNPKMKQFLQHQQHQHQYLKTYQYILRLMFLEYHPPTKKGGNASTCSIMMSVNFIFQNTVP